jgi:hypothetical protein
VSTRPFLFFFSFSYFEKHFQVLIIDFYSSFWLKKNILV